MKRTIPPPKKRRTQATPLIKRSVTTRHRPSPRPRKRPLLAHIRHTGRLLPHSATSYPLLAFLLLVVAVLMGVTSATSLADTGGDYAVHAVAPGIVPSSPAVITAPAAGTHFSTVPITVSGSCPANAAYIKLYRNDFFSGAALCQSGSFSLSSDLFQGGNILKARVFNQADQEGPVSNTITVYRDAVPITPPSGGAATAGAPSANASSAKSSTGTSTVPSNSAPSAPVVPITLTADYAYRGYYIGQEIAWQVGVSGGVTPYTIHVDWGDGQKTSQPQASEGTVTLTHSYTKRVLKQTAYVIKVTATDSSGTSAFVQLAVLISDPRMQDTSIVGSTTGTPSSGIAGIFAKLLPYAWPAYGVITVMFASFWLGEHREFNLLHRSIHRPRRLRHT